MKMMMKVMLMKIVVCVSDEVLNSQHYKHSQSTEASDQYANELMLYLNELYKVVILITFNFAQKMQKGKNMKIY